MPVDKIQFQESETKESVESEFIKEIKSKIAYYQQLAATQEGEQKLGTQREIDGLRKLI